VAVTAETHTAGLGSLILFDHIPDPSVTYSVKKIVPAVGEGEPTVTTYTEGTDYELKKSGIYLPASGSAILAEDTLTVAYTSLADHAIEAMTEVPAQVRVYIDGFNEAKSGRPVNVDIFNCKFSPAKSLDMISKDWAVIEVSATALRDDTKTGAGISKYMKLRFADVVAA